MFRHGNPDCDQFQKLRTPKVTLEPDTVFQPPGRINALAYITAKKAALYRTIMRLFMESKERFVFSLRAEDVFETVRVSGVGETLEQPEVESALAQLCKWGNLQRYADTTDVGTVKDFFKQ